MGGGKQVLEDTCRRQDFNPSEYDLKFQRTVLDLSLQWRFANLPNNAKLEMVPASRSRQGPENRVRIALQLDDGSRLQDTFCSGQTLWELLSHFAQTRECLQQPGEATPVCVYMRDEVTGGAALQSTTLQSLGLTGGGATIRFVMKPCDSMNKQDPVTSRSKIPGSPTCSVSADQASAGPLLPLSSGELSRGDLSHQGDTGTTTGTCLGGSPKPVDAQAKRSAKESAPAPFVPFSGGGQRLGGPSGSSKPPMSPSAKSPEFLSSPGGPSKPKKSKPGEEPQQDPEPSMDRDPVVCHPDLEDLLQAWPAELPDEFFEVTVDDVRRRLAQLKSERKRLEEAPLVTKAFREAQMKEKLERYPKAALRILFPDRYILQGFFRPSETVGDLREFVRSHLGNPELSFHLFIAPPKTILDDHTLTLFQPSGDGLPGIRKITWFWKPAPCLMWGACIPRALLSPSGSGQTSSLLPSCTLELRNQQAPAQPHYPPRAEHVCGRWGTHLRMGFLSSEALYLEPGLLEHTVSPSAADVLVARYMSRTVMSPPSPAAPDPIPLESEPTPEEGAPGPSEPIPGTAQPVRRSLGKVPKWLKLPASKR
ncbi:tether containing UBX domain for GLUT4 isoform X3 [Castor canadensis]|uniref:Tether containing UBX domain for GLUT4 isoform X2 n=1 Tax=Castor canadensis TaxID=51338 RepID=A0A8B7WII3_CASCN|nr:tether containing UBX domain for GLUT4 isoform X2 [Castor canadensis]